MDPMGVALRLGSQYHSVTEIQDFLSSSKSFKWLKLFENEHEVLSLEAMILQHDKT